MRNIDMIWKCSMCQHYMPIYYANGTCGIGCLAYNVDSPYPVNINRMEKCPLGRDEKK